MSKILVGRDNPKEVEVGNSLTRATKKSEDADAEKKEELAPAPVEVEQVVAVEEDDDAAQEAKETAFKGRGKKRGKA